MFWRVMKPQALQDAKSFFRGISSIETGWLVSVQIVQNHANALCLRVVPIYELLDLRGKVQRGSLLRHIDVAPTGERLDSHEDIRCPLSLVLVVLAFRLAWTQRQSLPCVRHQLDGL